MEIIKFAERFLKVVNLIDWTKSRVFTFHCVKNQRWVFKDSVLCQFESVKINQLIKVGDSEAPTPESAHQYFLKNLFIGQLEITTC